MESLEAGVEGRGALWSLYSASVEDLVESRLEAEVRCRRRWARAEAEYYLLFVREQSVPVTISTSLEGSLLGMCEFLSSKRSKQQLP